MPPLPSRSSFPIHEQDRRHHSRPLGLHPLPRQAAFPILGKPLLQHCWERCLKAKSVSQVIVATDDMRIAEAAFEFGAEVAVTSPKHPSGTDRVAEVARKLTGVTNIINVQGDEPAIDPRLIDKLAARLDDDRKLDMVTAAVPFADFVSAANPNNVKVVTSKDGRALYSPAASSRSTATRPARRSISGMSASTGIAGLSREVRGLETDPAGAGGKARATACAGKRRVDRRHHRQGARRRG